MSRSFDWLTVIAIVVFWGWLLRRILHTTPTNRLVTWLLVWFGLVVGAVMLWNVYISFAASN